MGSILYFTSIIPVCTTVRLVLLPVFYNDPCEADRWDRPVGVRSNMQFYNYIPVPGITSYKNLEIDPPILQENRISPADIRYTSRLLNIIPGIIYIYIYILRSIVNIHQFLISPADIR